MLLAAAPARNTFFAAGSRAGSCAALGAAFSGSPAAACDATITAAIDRHSSTTAAGSQNGRTAPMHHETLLEAGFFRDQMEVMEGRAAVRWRGALCGVRWRCQRGHDGAWPSRCRMTHMACALAQRGHDEAWPSRRRMRHTASALGQRDHDGAWPSRSPDKMRPQCTHDRLQGSNDLLILRPPKKRLR